MILKIPDHLSKDFISLIEAMINEFIASFGDDITENEQELLKFLLDFIATETK